MAGSYAADNYASRLELKRMIARLREPDFDQILHSDWTVATVLCHLAFWDRHMLYLLKRWKHSPFEPSLLSTDTVNAINDAVQTVSRYVPNRLAAQLAIENAEAVDQEIETLAEDLVARIHEAGLERIIRRSIHRNEHLQAIGGLLPEM